MVKKAIQWLLFRKIKNAVGELEAKGISITKLSAVVIGLMQAVEYAGPSFGYNIKFDTNIYALIASVGGIALKEGVDRSAPNS